MMKVFKRRVLVSWVRVNKDARPINKSIGSRPMPDSGAVAGKSGCGLFRGVSVRAPAGLQVSRLKLQLELDQWLA